jgi:uncharacterized protein with PhoU and TrkA domain
MRQVKPLKEMLVRMRDLSDLVIELGYAAILQHDMELADEVDSIKQEIQDLTFDMRVSAIYAAKGLSTKEIPQIASLLQIGVAAKEISDGVDDMVEIVARGVHPVIEAAYGRDIIIRRMVVEQDCAIDGKSLEKAQIPEETGFMIRAIRRTDDWIFDPDAKTVLKAGDILFLKGKDVAIRKMIEYAKAKSNEKEKKKKKK